MKYKQHIPTFCDGFEPIKIECNNTEELLKHESLQRHTTDPDFFRFSQDKHQNISIYYLMLELKEGTSWWVLGYVDTDMGLPKWEPKEKK
jgi:hypothetical protein